MIKEAIKAQENVGTVDVICSPGDFEFLQERLDSGLESNRALVNVNVKVKVTAEVSESDS